MKTMSRLLFSLLVVVLLQVCCQIALVVFGLSDVHTMTIVAGASVVLAWDLLVLLSLIKATSKRLYQMLDWLVVDESWW